MSTLTLVTIAGASTYITWQFIRTNTISDTYPNLQKWQPLSIAAALTYLGYYFGGPGGAVAGLFGFYLPPIIIAQIILSNTSK